MSRYQFIEQVATAEPVRVLCRMLHVSPAGYYQWLGRADRPTPAWEPAATAAFLHHAQRYGPRRLRAELRAEGHAVGRYALRSWLRRHDLRALSTRPHRPRTTVADPAAVVAENLLLGQPAPSAPNQVWVGDITYLPLVGGSWCYLATWRDTCSRCVVGWHLGQQMPTELVLTALEQALTLRQPAPGLIIHADRGSQYTSAACRARIEKAQALASYSRPGPMITPRPRRAGARSKPNYSRTAARLPVSKRPDWRSPTISTPTSTSTGGTPRSATARRINLNWTSCKTYLRCIVPERDGVPFDRSIQQKLWDKYFTAAPVQLRQYDVVSNVVRKASKR